jgi:translation initiation factor 1
MPKNESRTVWSSDQGDLRKQETSHQNGKSLPPHLQTAYLHRDSKGRSGGTVTLVKNLVLSNQDRKELAKKLKQICGSGGTVKGDVIEIQGEHGKRLLRL